MAHLVAQPVPGAIARVEEREALRVLVSSLARGGAERIVIEWLAAERRRGRAVELAVLHQRQHEYRVPDGVACMRRTRQSPEVFVSSLATRWAASEPPVSTHLVGDGLLARLWECGVRTVPVIHNTSEGWRNDPARWRAQDVPLALACAQAVRDEAVAAGCKVPVIALRHRPAPGPAVTDPRERARIRAALGIAPGAFVVGAVGAIKAQKDYPRAIEVLAHLRRSRDAVLVIAGGVLDSAGLAELERVAGAAAAVGVAGSLRLPGFVDPIEPWYAAFDALLNVSRHEGLSMATAEALASGLPVVATDVGGQRELASPRLVLLDAASPAGAIARALDALPVRESLAGASPQRPDARVWTPGTAWRRRRGPGVDTLFVTANLNAGGAQRSLVNLVQRIAGRRRIAVAVCGESTHPEFPELLRRAGVDAFRPAATADPFDVAEGVLARATRSGASSVCFWNADSRVKLVVARFAPPALRLVDASPGAYAYAELEEAAGLARALAFGPADYYARLDALVTKFEDRAHPPCRRVEVISNGVAIRDPAGQAPAAPRFLVSGRIAPSKRLEAVLEAFAMLSSAAPGASLEVFGQAEAHHRDYLEALVTSARGLAVAFRGAQPGLAFLGEPFTAAIVLGTNQGCPNSVLEAMSAGVAVIANASGGTGELVQDGLTGWLLPEACTASGLARAMQEAADDPARTARLGLAGRQRVASRHSLEAMAVRYLSLFDSLRPAAGATTEVAFDDGVSRFHPA